MQERYAVLVQIWDKYFTSTSKGVKEITASSKAEAMAKAEEIEGVRYASDAFVIDPQIHQKIAAEVEAEAKSESKVNDGPIHSIEDFIENTNFADLKAQKKALLKAQTNLLCIGGDENLKIADALDGLVVFIDSFQDMAVDVYGKDENEVFDLSDEDENDDGIEDDDDDKE